MRRGMVGVGAYLNRAHIKNFDATGNYEVRFQVANQLARKFSDSFKLAAALRDPLEQEQARREVGRSRVAGADTLLNVSADILSLAPSLVKDTVNHIDYTVRLIGEDHVGIGADVDMRQPGYESRFREITGALLDRGYRKEAIQKILGGNCVRVSRPQQ